LELYLQQPEIEIDNNLVENAIWPAALGKRTGSFSVTPMQATAAPSFTPSSKVAIVTALNLTLTCPAS
jgi:transposase IS66 family protein